MISKLLNIFRSKKTERKIVYFNHTKQTYIIPNVPSLNYNVWYNFSCNLRYTIEEQKEIHNLINSIINVTVLSHLIYEYVDDKYDLKLCILMYDNRFCKIIFKYPSDHPDYKGDVLRCSDNINYKEALSEFHELHARVDMLNARNNSNYSRKLDDNFENMYKSMKSQEKYNDDLFFRDHLYVHTYDKLSGYSSCDYGRVDYIKQYHYGDIPIIQEILTELGTAIQKKLIRITVCNTVSYFIEDDIKINKNI